VRNDLAAGSPQHLAESLRLQIETNTAATGVQAVVMIDGSIAAEVAWGVDGLGETIDSTSMVALYCCGKMFTAMAVATLIDHGELSFDDVIGDVLQGQSCEAVAAVTIAQLLSHRSGVSRPSFIEGTTLNPAIQLRKAMSTERVRLQQHETLYTECAAWVLLAECVKVLSRQPLSQFVTDRVLRPLQLDEQFELMGGAAPKKRLTSSIAADGRVRPMLIEAGGAFGLDRNAGYGGFGSMSGITAIIDSVRRSADGSMGEIVSTDTATQLINSGPRLYDLNQQRWCSFGLGLATDLVNSHFGPVSSRAVGLAGLTGMVSVATDPERQLSAAIWINELRHPSSGEQFVTGQIAEFESTKRSR
jgi:CubicO group peptidase (beta-lactamase class C family)